MSLSRDEYEREVRALATWAEQELDDCRGIEEVGREAVEKRNALKVKYCSGLPEEWLTRLAQRNVAKYGHPVGPTADALLHRYGSWEAVISAAARPATLPKLVSPRTLPLKRR